jgi:hypothetical protein
VTVRQTHCDRRRGRAPAAQPARSPPGFGPTAQTCAKPDVRSKATRRARRGGEPCTTAARLFTSCTSPQRACTDCRYARCASAANHQGGADDIAGPCCLFKAYCAVTAPRICDRRWRRHRRFRRCYFNPDARAPVACVCHALTSCGAAHWLPSSPL